MAAVTLLVTPALAPRAVAQSPTPVPVLTWRYDLTHSGANTQETELTPANVSSGSFGKLFSLSVDDHVFAQPLYVPSLKMSDGRVHNVIFVATENDSVYAFDADAKASPIWQISLLSTSHGAASGATAIPQTDVAPSEDIGPRIGITGTPAINPANNTMYVVSNTKESGKYFSRLHAINIVSGAEQPGSPVTITATVAGTGDGSSGGQVSFNPLWTNQRAALNYYNGYVYIGYSSHGDISPYHGWLFAYDASTLQQKAAICLSPNHSGASVWGSGAGMPIDTAANRMYIVTGNGARTTPFQSNSDYGESVIALNIANGQLTPVDAWTAFNLSKLNTMDWDQGSGGLLMLPDQPGTHPHLLITAGKEGRITVLNRDSLGGFASGASSNTNALQDLTLSAIPQGEGFWGTAAYWNGHVYMWAGGDIPQNNGVPNVGMMFKVNNGVMDTSPDSETSFTSAFPGPTFSISSNGTQNGIVWAVKPDQFNSGGPAVLYAFNPDNLSDVLYASNSKSSDTGGRANKFSVPVVTNGKVYIAAWGEVDVYGLLNAQQTADAPAISPNGGTFTTKQSVTLSSGTPSAQIYYTLDGSTPTTGSTQYTGPITLSSDTTVKAIATAAGYLQSSVSSAAFTFSNQAPAPLFSPAGGTYSGTQTVTLSDSDASATIYYTTDGSTPSSSSTAYSSPIAVSSSETIKAIAIDPALATSNVASAAFVIQSQTTPIDFSGGFASTAGLQLNGNAVQAGNQLELTTNGTWQKGSVFWTTPVNVQAFTTDFQFQLLNAKANGFTFTLQNVGPTALGSGSASLGYYGIARSVAIKFNFYNYQSEGSDCTGVYTDGAHPYAGGSIDISPSGIQLASGDKMLAHITYDGATLSLKLTDLATNKTFTMSQAINIPQVVGAGTAYAGFTAGTGGLAADQNILNWTYSTQAPAPQTAPPTFAPPAGTYSSAQNVTLSDSTSGATIYYTTDGSTPTASSPVYSAPIPVSSSMTIKAVATSSLGTSAVAAASYTIGASSASFALSGSSFVIGWRGGVIHVPISVTPSGGFTGTVTLGCSVSAPAGAASIPTCTVSTQPPAITGSTAVTGKIYVQTVSTTTKANYSVTVTGSSGALNSSTTIPFTVN